MSATIDDILNPKPEPDTAEEKVMEVVQAATSEGQALTRAEILRACHVDWTKVAEPGEGGLLLLLGMEFLAHETGVRERFDALRSAALDRLVKKGLIVAKKHNGAVHYWAADFETS